MKVSPVLIVVIAAGLAGSGMIYYILQQPFDQGRTGEPAVVEQPTQSNTGMEQSEPPAEVQEQVQEQEQEEVKEEQEEVEPVREPAGTAGSGESRHEPVQTRPIQESAEQSGETDRGDGSVVECKPSSIASNPSPVLQGFILELTPDKSYGIAGSMVGLDIHLESSDESVLFKYTRLRVSWISHDGSQVSEWESREIPWDYSDYGIAAEIRMRVRVPDTPPGTTLLLAACVTDTSGSSTLGHVAREFRVAVEEKEISYYTVESTDDVVQRLIEALNDRGIMLESSDEAMLKSAVEQVLNKEGDDEHGISIAGRSYMLVDAVEGSLYALSCITSNLNVKAGDILQCLYIGSSEQQYMLEISAVYSDGVTEVLHETDVDAGRYIHVFKYRVDGSDGRLHIVAMAGDIAVLEVSLPVISMMSLSDLCVPWVDRQITISFEPEYAMPGSDVRAKIGIRILPEDESMRWMFEYIAVTWLDDANRPLPTSWRLAGDESISSTWRNPLKVINWDDGDDDIYTGSVEIVLKVPQVEKGTWVKLLACFVHPMPGGYMDMVNSHTLFYVGDEPPQEQVPQQQEQDQQQQQQQQQQQGALPCSIYPGGDRQITFIIEPRSGASGSSVTAKLAVRVNPDDYGEPFDPTKHWRWMYEDVKFFWLDRSNNILSSAGPVKVVQWSSSDPLYGEGEYQLTVPSSSSRDVRLLACFVHPMPGGYMEMTYRMADFTITDASPSAGTQGQQQNQQRQNQPQHQEQGRIEPINLDIGEICGRYTSDREFISLSIRPDGGYAIASVRVALDSRDPNLEIWKFMYSYIKFRWYNYSTGTYITGWIPDTPIQLIREWSNDGEKVIGRAEYRVELPDASPGSRLGLIACFSHPWSSGYMDMNYTVAGYLMPSSYHRINSIGDLTVTIIALPELSGLDPGKVGSISSTLDQIRGMLNSSARYLMLDVREGSLYMLICLLEDIPVVMGDSVQCIALTDDTAVSGVSITTVEPDGIFTKRSYTMQRIGDNMVAVADLTLNRAGGWVIVAEFSDGNIRYLKPEVAFNVVPEGVFGVAGIIVTALTTAVLYLIRRARPAPRHFLYLVP